MSQPYISLNHSFKNMTIVYEKDTHPKKISLSPRDIEFVAKDVNSPVIDQMLLMFPNVFKMTVNASFRRDYLDIIQGRAYSSNSLFLSEELKELPFLLIPSGTFTLDSKPIVSIHTDVTYQDLKRFISVAHDKLQTLHGKIRHNVRTGDKERHLFFVNGSYCYYTDYMDDIYVFSDQEAEAMLDSLRSLTQKDLDYFIAEIQPPFGLFDVEGLTEFDYIEKSTLKALQHARSLYFEINGKLTADQVVEFIEKNGLGITQVKYFS